MWWMWPFWLKSLHRQGVVRLFGGPLRRAPPESQGDMSERGGMWEPSSDGGEEILRIQQRDSRQNVRAPDGAAMSEASGDGAAMPEASDGGEEIIQIPSSSGSDAEAEANPHRLWACRWSRMGMPLHLALSRVGPQPASTVLDQAELDWLVSPAGREFMATRRERERSWTAGAARPSRAPRPAGVPTATPPAQAAVAPTAASSAALGEAASESDEEMPSSDEEVPSEDATIRVWNYLEEPVEEMPVDVDLDDDPARLRTYMANFTSAKLKPEEKLKPEGVILVHDGEFLVDGGGSLRDQGVTDGAILGVRRPHWRCYDVRAYICFIAQDRRSARARR